MIPHTENMAKFYFLMKHMFCLQSLLEVKMHTSVKLLSKICSGETLNTSNRELNYLRIKYKFEKITLFHFMNYR